MGVADEEDDEIEACEMWAMLTVVADVVVTGTQAPDDAMVDIMASSREGVFRQQTKKELGELTS